MQTIKTLAAEMGVTESDLKGWIDCIGRWMAKGYDLEQAIEKHTAQMTRLLNCADRMPTSVVVDAFFPAVYRAPKAEARAA